MGETKKRLLDNGKLIGMLLFGAASAAFHLFDAQWTGMILFVLGASSYVAGIFDEKIDQLDRRLTKIEERGG